MKEEVCGCSDVRVGVVIVLGAREVSAARSPLFEVEHLELLR